MGKFFKGKKILVTGGAGSFGSALVDEILTYEPKVVRIFDNNEESLFKLKQRLNDGKNVRYLVGDVRDKPRLIVAIEGMDILLHAAALKHVESCEYNPFEAVKTNVVGTQNLIDVAMDEDVEKIMFTSTDKAANPTNVMGTTKLLAEKLTVTANHYKGDGKSIFSCVRFGNVIGSSGSVVPLFTKQIRDGGPVTITDTNMTRFVISTSQAVNLVLEATMLSHGGEVFIMKMPSLRIDDLAEVMIRELAPRFGKKPGDIEVKIIGSKAGEKLYEDLMTEEEITRSVETEDMFIILPQLTELLSTIRKNYPHSHKPKAKSYRSSDIKQLSKKEIKELLSKEGLL